MRQKISNLIKKIFAPVVLTAALTASSFFGQAQESKSGKDLFPVPIVKLEDYAKLKSANGMQEDYTKLAIMDPFSQPNIHILNGMNKFDYQSSGDVDNDEDRDMDDVYLLEQEVINPGTFTKDQKKRGNVNGDFVKEKKVEPPEYDTAERRDTITQDDVNILYEFVTGQRDHLPGQINKLNAQEKLDWIIPRIKANIKFPINYNGTDFLCGEYSQRLEINFTGIKGFEKWFVYDRFKEFTKNSTENVPLFAANTTTLDGVAHTIPCFFIGSQSSATPDDPTKFNQWYFFDYRGYTNDKGGNRNDTLQVIPGDFYMADDNKEVNITGFTNLEGIFLSTSLVKFNLNNGIAENIYTSPYLLRENPEEIYLDHEYYPDTIKIDISDSLPNMSYEYSSNTTHYQDSIKQKQTTFPENRLNELESEYLVEDVISMTMGRWTKSDTARTIVQRLDLKAPVIKTPNDTIVGYTHDNSNITPEILGYATATDNSGYDVNITYEDSLIEETPTFKHYERTCAEDWKGNVSTSTQDIKMDKTIGLEDVLTKNFKVYPNPSKGIVNIEGNLDHYDQLKWEIYDMTGRLIKYGKEDYFPGDKETINFSGTAPGNYFFKILYNKKSFRQKIIIKE